MVASILIVILVGRGEPKMRNASVLPWHTITHAELNRRTI